MLADAPTDAESLWAGSDEWDPWTEAPQIRRLQAVASDSFDELWLVEALLDPPRQFLIGFGQRVTDKLGFPRAARAFNVPVGWEGGPLELTDLAYAGDVIVARTPDDLPSLSPERRERRRKGWAF
jgi:hypothetical protein